MDQGLLIVSLRNGALYLQPEPESKKAEPVDPENPEKLSPVTLGNLEQLMSRGYVLDRKATIMFNELTQEDQAQVIEVINDVYGTSLNWNALVKGWTTPTNESVSDHITTLFYNLLINTGEIENHGEADLLPCGHYIPRGTFDIDRYTGCPYCGTPITTSANVYLGQGSRFRTLRAWTDIDAFTYFKDLLQSTVPLTPTEIDSLKILLSTYELPDVKITMRETAILAALTQLEYDDIDSVCRLIKTPADVLRLLWYDSLGQLQVIKPKTMLKAAMKYGFHICPDLDESDASVIEMANRLKVKYSRKFCRQVATVITRMDITADKACETMNPRRGMWVRFIRALRLTEYAKKPGYERLALILDKFYRHDYFDAQGQIDLALDMNNYPRVIELLSPRPGMFARSLFSLMLRFNPYRVLADFVKIIDKIPLRIIVSLGNNAEIYFKNDTGKRAVRTITGVELMVPVNPRLEMISEEERLNIIEAVKHLTIDALVSAYAKTPEPGKKIYIDPELLYMVLPVGERPQTIQNAMYVPQGTRFDVEGDKVRLFLHWGKGMKAAPIDLDISASIIYDDSEKNVPCAYFNLSPKGALHSGDMRAIPDDVGTAEYIELDIPTLAEDGARYVVFCANQYTTGRLLPNAMAGWMDSKYPMEVSAESGVAYDPSCVQHFVKVNDTMLTKGLVFGVLDVRHRKITYMETPFDGQTVSSLDHVAVLTMLHKLTKKLSIGKALELMAEARQMVVVENKEDIDADTTVYDRQWAHDMAAVVKLLIPDRTQTVDE